MEKIIIDVREKDEFKNEHVSRAINLPLSSFPQDAPPLLENLVDKKIVIMCLSGKRAAMAFDHIKNMPNINFENYEVYPEGIKGWKNECKKVVAIKDSMISIMRQVQIAAGSLIILGGALGTFINPNFWFISTFIGVGLTFAGITGTCGLAEILRKMPWNNYQQ